MKYTIMYNALLCDPEIKCVLNSSWMFSLKQFSGNQNYALDLYKYLSKFKVSGFLFICFFLWGRGQGIGENTLVYAC